MARLARHIPLIRLSLVVLFALSIGLAGGAHRVERGGDVDPALQAYLAAGGTMDALCVTEPGQTTFTGGCPLCVLHTGANMAAFVQPPRPAPRVVARFVRRADLNQPRPQHAGTAPCIRGPPLRA